RARSAALLYGSLQIPEMVLDIALNFEIKALPRYELMVLRYPILDLTNEPRQFVVGEPPCLRRGEAHSSGRFDQQADSDGMTDRIPLKEREESFILQASSLPRLIELLFDDDVLGVLAERCIWIDDKRLRPAAGDTPARQSLDLLEHCPDFG